MGIWEYQDYFVPQVDKAYQLSSNEGNTLTRSSHVLATMLGVQNIHLKREDLNPSGSHKDRTIAFQMSAHMQEGAKSFVLSSTGNAAISAILYSKFLNIDLHVFLSPKVVPSKVARLEQILEKPLNLNGEEQVVEVDNYVFHFSKRPVSDSVKYAKETEAVLLRASTDPYALEGYKTIAFELIKQAPQAKEIFVPVSSGTAAIGIYEGYKQLNEKMSLEIDIPEIHIVQTTRINTLAREYDKDFEKTEDSVIDSITDRIGHRKAQIDKVIKESKGWGWVVNDEQILKAESLLRFANITASAEGAMAVAAIKKAISFDKTPERPVCIVTGIQN
jgi:threonine synthase